MSIENGGAGKAEEAVDVVEADLEDSYSSE